MTSFESMKKNSKNSMASLNEKMAKFKTKTDYNDDRIWKPTRDQAGNGQAVIRFLPTSKDGDSPFAQIYTHSFKINGKYYIENCPTSIGAQCPVN